MMLTHGKHRGTLRPEARFAVPRMCRGQHCDHNRQCFVKAGASPYRWDRS